MGMGFYQAHDTLGAFTGLDGQVGSYGMTKFYSVEGMLWKSLGFMAVITASTKCMAIALFVRNINLKK